MEIKSRVVLSPKIADNPVDNSCKSIFFSGLYWVLNDAQFLRKDSGRSWVIRNIINDLCVHAKCIIWVVEQGGAIPALPPPLYVFHA